MNESELFNTWLIAVTAAVLVGSQVRAQGLARSQKGPEENPVVTQKVDDGIYVMDGNFALETSSAAAWAVLGDSEAMGEFVSHMRRGAVKQRPAGALSMEQEGVDEAFFISKELNVLLDVRKTPFRSIEFKDISNKDFELYRGSWRIRAAGNAIRVRYHLEARPRMKAPNAQDLGQA